ncbi:MAG TPA: BrnT family toxin [Caulobacteraceae bacterium]
MSEEIAGFEWDPFKAQINAAKHGVSFVAASNTMLGVTLTRPALEEHENRFASIGINEGRLIVVIWTPRHDVMRIISARRARRYEREAYRQAIRQAGGVADAD